MNAKLASLAVVAALFASSAFAGQPNGRDSTYPDTRDSFPSAKSTAVAMPRDGRGSVYASDLPAPTAKDQVKVAAVARAGRA